MTILQSIILGMIQGITEFMPISSSGHLVLVPYLLHWPIQSTEFDVVLHAGTLVAVLIYFWPEIQSLVHGLVKREQHSVILTRNLIISTIPAAVIGFLLQDFIDSYFKSPVLVSISLIIVALIMFIVEKIKQGNKKTISSLKSKTALIIGISQALALIRGVSRSGITIITGMVAGLKREEAARYTFLMSIPIIGGSFIYESIKYRDTFQTLGTSVVMSGFISATIFGYITIRVLMRFLQNHTLQIFAIYRILLGIFILLVFFKFQQ